jgi:hypothetical protein
LAVYARAVLAFVTELMVAYVGSISTITYGLNEPLRLIQIEQSVAVEPFQLYVTDVISSGWLPV